MRRTMTLALFALLSGRAETQGAGGAKLTTPTGQQAADLVRAQLYDTSLVHRYVAHDRLRRASPAVRRAAVTQLTLALTDTSRRVRRAALTALEGMGPDAAPALSAVMGIISDPRDPLRMSAFHSFSRMRMGAAGRAGIPFLRTAARDSDESVHDEAASGLISVGDTASALEVYRASLHSTVDYHQLAAAHFFAERSEPVAIPVLQSLLADTAFFRRVAAVRALGIEGPRAAAAIPALIEMLGDSSTSGAPFSYGESTAAYAASALSRILPFRGGGGNIPLRARIEGPSNSLGSDGLGVYSWGVDSVFIVKVDAITFMLASDNSPRGPFGSERRALRRSMSFDLAKPAPGSGAKALGVIRDNEAQIHIWYRRAPGARGAVSFNLVPVSDSVRTIDRVELHFRINGDLHILQMGPFVEGQGPGPWPSSGLHGEGTSRAQLTHPTSGVWTVRADTGSVARLWNLKDRARAVDRGLYSFSLQIRFMAFPSGDAACLQFPMDYADCSR